MPMVMFYHLTRSSPEQTLALLLRRSLEKGWRVMVRGTDRAALERLDAALWQGPEDSFLPHGLQGGAQDALQPVLLGQGEIGNAAEALLLIDAAETTAVEAAKLERVMVLFDGANDPALAAARGLWTTLTSAGLPAQYWSEESGSWKMKTERKAAE
jgi:DNA polymerase-3 subunit chi